jgi:NADPH:quinone reductase-like Zn-dependent oxidoreductase
MLFNKGRLTPGETILIHGIGGGVALAALQLAHAAGCPAIVTSSSKEKLDRARHLGATGTIDYGKEDVAARVKDLTSGRGVDLAFDTVGAATLPASLAAVRRGGRIVTCGVTGGSRVEVELRSIYWSQVELIGSTMGSIEDRRRMLAFVEATGIKPIISNELPIEQAREALMLMDKGAQFGKIALKVSG